MPSKIRPDDWDRLFAPNAPRRGGPLRALLTILITVIVIALLGAGMYLLGEARLIESFWHGGAIIVVLYALRYH